MSTKTIDELKTWWHKTNGTGTDACSKCTPNHVCSWHTERLADIETLITEARIDEVENHPKKSDNRWRDDRLAQLKENK